jgi:hypothetical protein
MPMFVNPRERVSVEDEAGNVVWIRAKMDYATKSKVQDALASMRSDTSDGPDEAGFDLHLGRQNLVLLLNNVVGWEGPDFTDERGRPIPCTPTNIKALDPDEPLVDRVLSEIQQRNMRPESPLPKSHTTDGSTSATEPSLTESE